MNITDSYMMVFLLCPRLGQAFFESICLVFQNKDVGLRILQRNVKFVLMAMYAAK